MSNPIIDDFMATFGKSPQKYSQKMFMKMGSTLTHKP